MLFACIAISERSLSVTKKRLEASLGLWLQTFDVCFPASTTAQGSRWVKLGIPLLRIHYSMASVMISACLEPGNEMLYDSHTISFASIVRQAVDLWNLTLQEHNIVNIWQDYIAPEPSFTAGTGFIPPLYFTALKCRVPKIRREAINLILSAPHREGLWDGLLAAQVANRIMMIEEKNCRSHAGISVSSDLITDSRSTMAGGVSLIPKTARVHQSSVILPHKTGGKAILVYQLCAIGEESQRGPKTTEIDVVFGRVSCGTIKGCLVRNSDGNGRPRK